MEAEIVINRQEVLGGTSWLLGMDFLSPSGINNDGSEIAPFLPAVCYLGSSASGSILSGTLLFLGHVIISNPESIDPVAIMVWQRMEICMSRI